MIKFETNANPEGMAYLKIDGTPNEICKETSAMVKGVFESLNEKKDMLGVIFLSHLTESIKDIVHEYEMERFSPWEEILMKLFNDIEKKNKPNDIRESDFDSEKQFTDWLRGMAGEEDKDA